MRWVCESGSSVLLYTREEEAGSRQQVSRRPHLIWAYGRALIVNYSFARKPSPSRDFYASLDPGRHYSQDSIRSDYAQQAMPPPPTRWSSDHSQIQFGQYPFDFNGNNVQQPEPTMDLPWLPISPNSLLHPQPGEVDSASEGSPMGRWLHNTMAVNEWEQALFGPLPPSDPPSAGGSSSNRPDQAAPVPGMPTKKSRVEDIVAWSVIMKILHAYHAHL